MNPDVFLKTFLLFASIQDVWNKGAKVRPKKLPRPKVRPGGGFGGPGGSSASNNLDGSDSDMYGYEGGVKHRNASHEERLLMYLFRNYDPVARAVMDTSKTVLVNVDFVLLRIHGLDERSQVLTTTGLVIADWTDERLTWDPEKFGNLTDVIVKADKLWLPELAVMNGADELIPDFERIRVLLSHNGALHWEPGGIFRTTCDIDIAYFPFDEQHCPMLIGAYSYYSTKMNISNREAKISTHDFRLNGEWHVYDTDAIWNLTVLDCCPGKGYPHVVFILHLRRRNKFYMMNIVLPCIMLSVLIMIGFFLPPDAGEKISLGISVLLAFTVFLLMIADNIPRTSLAIPLMVVYLTATMTLGTVSVCLTVLVLNVHHRGAQNPIPNWASRLILVYVAKMLCMKTSQQQIHYQMRQTHHLRHSRSTMDKIYVKRRDKMMKMGTNTNTTDGNGIMEDMELLSLTINSNSTTSSKKQQNSTITANGPKMLNCMNSSALHHVDISDHSDEDDVPDYSKQWHELAHVLDRLFFWFLLAAMTISALVILLYPQYMDLHTR